MDTLQLIVFLVLVFNVHSNQESNTDGFHLRAVRNHWELDERRAKTIARVADGERLLYRRKRWSIKAFWGEEENEHEEEEYDEQVYCKATCWAGWQAWSHCNAPCGNGGNRIRTRTVRPNKPCTCPSTNKQTEPCNRKCYNSGSATHRDRCTCSQGYRGTCCENAVVCGNPGSPQHGVVSPSGSVHSYNTRVTYSCAAGYELTQATKLSWTRMCQSNGRWSGSLPQCVKKKCPHPGAPQNGKAIAPAKLEYESLIQFTCDVGFFMKGAETTVCLANGQYTNAVPTCTKGGCGDPGTPLHGSRLGSSFMYNDMVTYQCESGYELVGSAERKCQADGLWSCEQPKCLPTDTLQRKCVILDSIANGNIATTQGYLYQSIAEYSCDEGYYLDGLQHRACQSDEEWSGRAPVCKEILCEPLTEPLNGEINQPPGIPAYGSKAEFSCKKGHRLVGNEERICLGEGSIGIWSGTQPFCQEITCGPPDSPANGRIVGYSFSWGDDPLQLECGPGYYLHGSTQLTCTEEGMWVGNQNEAPLCIECPLDYYSSDINSDVECSKCPNNKVTQTSGSSDIRQCICIEGTRQTDDGQCEEIRCDLPEVKARVFPSGTCSVYYGNVCSFKCEPGHVRYMGDISRTCDVSGQWSGTPLECAPCPVDSYKLDEILCAACHANSYTTNTGSSKSDCIPLAGYRIAGDGKLEDINECMNRSSNPCQQMENCINTPGGAHCQCPDGFIPDGFNSAQRLIHCTSEDERCPKLEAPINGALQCIRSDQVESCMPYCENDREFPEEFDMYVFCGPATSYRWSHEIAEKSMPDCVDTIFGKPSVNGVITYPGEDCAKLTDEQKQLAINEFLAIAEKEGICYKDPGHHCEIYDASADCDDNVVLRVKRDATDSQRSANSSGIRFHFKFKFNPTLDSKTRQCQDQICRKKYGSLIEFTQQTAVQQLERLVGNCELCLEDGNGTTLRPSIHTDLQIECPPGAVHKANTKHCVCERFFRFDKNSNQCINIQTSEIRSSLDLESSWENADQSSNQETYDYDCDGTSYCTQENIDQDYLRWSHRNSNKYIECNPDSPGTCRIVRCREGQTYDVHLKHCV